MLENQTSTCKQAPPRLLLTDEAHLFSSMRARAAGDIAAAPLPALPLPAAAPPLPVFHAPPELCWAYGREDAEDTACRGEEREIHSPGLGAAYDTIGQPPERKRTTRHEKTGKNVLCRCQAEKQMGKKRPPNTHEILMDSGKRPNSPRHVSDGMQHDYRSPVSSR